MNSTLLREALLSIAPAGADTEQKLRVLERLMRHSETRQGIIPGWMREILREVRTGRL